MVRQRPAILMIMAIFNMVFGGLGLLCGVCALMGQALQGFGGKGGPAPGGRDPTADVQAFLDKELPANQIIEGGTGVLLLFLGVVLILAGVGLLLVQSWGRWVSLGYALLTIFTLTGYIIYKIAFVKPAAERWMRMQGGGFDGRGFNQAEATAFTSCFFGALLGTTLPFIIYSVVLLIILFLPAFSAAFGEPPRRRFMDEDEDDYDDRRDNRRDDRDAARDRRIRRRRDDEDY